MRGGLHHLVAVARNVKILYNYCMSKFHGFPPVFDGNSRVLILGSFPSVKSRQAEFYYGNKQNRFWATLSEAFEEQPVTTVDGKKRLCLNNGIALWDIVESCEIRGSMDADITHYTLVDLSLILDKCKREKILCNGATAYKLTKSVYSGNIPVYKLSSTSPANPRFNKDEWLYHLK